MSHIDYRLLNPVNARDSNFAELLLRYIMLNISVLQIEGKFLLVLLFMYIYGESITTLSCATMCS